MKRCILHAEKVCNDCGECDDRCELDPNKICDNCFRCLDEGTPAYAEIPISGVYLSDEYSPEREEAVRANSDDDGFVPDLDEDWKIEESVQAKTLPMSSYGERVKRAHEKR
jgi:hypothetical protein